MRHREIGRRLGAGALSVLLVGPAAGGCTHWRTQSAFPEAVAAKHPAKLRVTRTDGRRIVLHQPSLSGDTLYGAPRKRARTGETPPAVAMADVSALAVRKFDAVGTTALTLTATAVAAVLTFAALWSNRAD